MSHHLFIASFAALLAAGPAACAWAAQPQAASPASPAAPSAAAPPAGQPAAPAATSPAAFPASWYGTWRGPMTVAAAAGRPISAEMELRIAPTDAPGQTTWTLSYLDKALPGGRQDRPYVLKSLDPAQGRYEIDERNGIILPATFLAGGLYAPFRLQDTLLQASYRLDGDRLVVEILSFNLAKPTTSGGQDGVPEVKGYAAGTLQRAVLSKVGDAGAAAPAAPASGAAPASTPTASPPASPPASAPTSAPPAPPAPPR